MLSRGSKHGKKNADLFQDVVYPIPKLHSMLQNQ